MSLQKFRVHDVGSSRLSISLPVGIGHKVWIAQIQAKPEESSNVVSLEQISQICHIDFQFHLYLRPLHNVNRALVSS